MCRALKVLCVAEDPTALRELKRAVVSAEWELAPGATSTAEAMRQLHEERPHALVVFGAFPGLIEQALEAYPYVRVISDRAVQGAVSVSGLDRVRAALKTRSGPGGPVRT